MVFMINFIKNFEHMIVNSLAGITSKNEIDMIEIFNFNLMDTISIVLRDFMVQIPSILYKNKTNFKNPNCVLI